jgi:hypothetical protein
MGSSVSYRHDILQLMGAFIEKNPVKYTKNITREGGAE